MTRVCSHLATAVAVVGLLRATEAAQTCATAGALIPQGWPGYEAGFDNLLPQGRTYCDQIDPEDADTENFCDACPETCIMLESTINVVKKQLAVIADQTSQWDVLENDIDTGCSLLQTTCQNGVTEGNTWSSPVYAPYPADEVHWDTELTSNDGSGPRAASGTEGVSNWGPDVVGLMSCAIYNTWLSDHGYAPGPETCSYCSYCESIAWGAGGRRRMQGDPYPAEMEGKKAKLVVDSATVLGLGSTAAALDDCEVTTKEMSGSARFLAKATQRHHRNHVQSFTVPGCAISASGSIAQALDGKRRVTLTTKTWNSLGPSVDGIMPVRSASKIVDALALANDFRGAGCGQFQLEGDVCDELEVVAFEVLSSTPIDVTVHAIFRLSGDKHLVEAQMANKAVQQDASLMH